MNKQKITSFNSYICLWNIKILQTLYFYIIQINLFLYILENLGCSYITNIVILCFLNFIYSCLVFINACLSKKITKKHEIIFNNSIMLLISTTILSYSKNKLFFYNIIFIILNNVFLKVNCNYLLLYEVYVPQKKNIIFINFIINKISLIISIIISKFFIKKLGYFFLYIILILIAVLNIIWSYLLIKSILINNIKQTIKFFIKDFFKILMFGIIIVYMISLKIILIVSTLIVLLKCYTIITTINISKPINICYMLLNTVIEIIYFIIPTTTLLILNHNKNYIYFFNIKFLKIIGFIIVFTYFFCFIKKKKINLYKIFNIIYFVVGILIWQNILNNYSLAVYLIFMLAEFFTTLIINIIDNNYLPHSKKNNSLILIFMYLLGNIHVDLFISFFLYTNTLLNIKSIFTKYIIMWIIIIFIYILYSKNKNI